MTDSDINRDNDKLQEELDWELNAKDRLYPLRKRDMLEALGKSLGIVSTACIKVGIARQTHYRWLKEDEEYVRLCNECIEQKRDFIETTLLSAIQKDNITALMKGTNLIKDRGYGERVEHTGADGTPLKWVEIKNYGEEKEGE